MLVLASGHALADNASNPLAAVNGTDIRVQRLDLVDGSYLIDALVDFMAGLGADRPYDWGVGLGVRFNY